MVKLKELKQLAEILRERLLDGNPDPTLILRCVEPIWPYIYPFGLLSYMKGRGEDTDQQLDQLKMRKILRAVTGPKRCWRSFIIGLFHTYRDRHSIERARARMIKKSMVAPPVDSFEELSDLAEKFREQALQCQRAIERFQWELTGDPSERIMLLKSIRNDENIPRFIILGRYIP
ncbi:MAG: hypothetical protein K6U74_06940, partial [Firmicutes bacterium]|nr:hypothetical protein [Bacillota bacterium]